MQEAFLLPLFFFIGAVINDKEELENRLKTGLLFTFLIYIVLTVFIIAAARPLTILMAQDKSIINETVNYIRLESTANIINILFKFILVALITIKKDKNIYIPLLIQLILIIILDIFFISNLSVSLKLGVNGIAYTNIIVSSILLITSFILLHIEKINIWKIKKLNFKWFKSFFRISSISGLETLVRNLFFMFMIVKMVNAVGGSGDFWLTNNFIWGWLLLPILQLSEVVKADIGRDGHKAIEKIRLDTFLL
ncbi:hypothetical protein [Metamycoplasma phocicerebrale]|nr:hypothetical protein [Metamycoplasma phocicerebrale]